MHDKVGHWMVILQIRIPMMGGLGETDSFLLFGTQCVASAVCVCVCVCVCVRALLGETKWFLLFNEQSSFKLLFHE